MCSDQRISRGSLAPVIINEYDWDIITRKRSALIYEDAWRLSQAYNQPMKAHHYKDEGWTTFERNERFPLIVLPTSPRRTLKAYGGLAEGVDTRCSMYLSREVGKFFGLSRECHVSSVSSRFSFLFFSFFSLRFSFFFFSLARWSSCVTDGFASRVALFQPARSRGTHVRAHPNGTNLLRTHEQVG